MEALNPRLISKTRRKTWIRGNFIRMTVLRSYGVGVGGLLRMERLLELRPKAIVAVKLASKMQSVAAILEINQSPWHLLSRGFRGFASRTGRWVIGED
jgi:hypothetical protein